MIARVISSEHSRRLALAVVDIGDCAPDSAPRRTRSLGVTETVLELDAQPQAKPIDVEARGAPLDADGLADPARLLMRGSRLWIHQVILADRQPSSRSGSLR
jgi:hypothetical protein